MRYSGKWALVTGASSGIGEAFALELARRGMMLVLTARRLDKLDELARRIRTEFGREAIAIPADLAVTGAAEELWSRASSGRDPYLLVNNAGFGLHGEFADLPLKRQSEMVHLNCLAPLQLAHLALEGMRQTGEGAILNVASVVAFQPIPSYATYAASKAFLLALSEALSAEEQSNVRISAVCPGPTPTEFQEVAGSRPAYEKLGSMSRDQVVKAALRGLEKNRPVVVPGLTNRAAALMGGLIPHRWSLPIAARLSKRRRLIRF